MAFSLWWKTCLLDWTWWARWPLFSGLATSFLFLWDWLLRWRGEADCAARAVYPSDKEEGRWECCTCHGKDVSMQYHIVIGFVVGLTWARGNLKSYKSSPCGWTIPMGNNKHPFHRD